MIEDREIFGEGYGPETFLRLEEIDDGRLLLLGVQHGWMRNDIFVMDPQSGEVHPVIEDERAHVNARYEEGRLLLTTDLDASNYRVIAIPTAGVDPSRWSDRSRWTDWIPEQEHLLRGYTTIGDRTYVELLANVASRILVFEAGDGAALEPVDEIPLPEYHTASLSKLGEDGAMLTLSSFTVPQTRYRLDLETWERELIEPPRPEYDGSEVVVEQVWYTSKDGTEAPMYIMRPRGVELDGNLPTLLHGYGGFNVSVTPSFRAQAAVWVEAGGAFAVATLRGGSEFGEDWHRDGMLENKQNVFDDFISSARMAHRKRLHEPGPARDHGRKQRRPARGQLLHAAARALPRGLLRVPRPRHGALLHLHRDEQHAGPARVWERGHPPSSLSSCGSTRPTRRSQTGPTTRR